MEEKRQLNERCEKVGVVVRDNAWFRNLMSLLYHRLSGLIVDVFGDMAVIASSAAWVEKYKPEIEACISRIGEINHINWRPSMEILKEEGLDVSNLKDLDSSTCPARTKVNYIFLFFPLM